MRFGEPVRKRHPRRPPPDVAPSSAAPPAREERRAGHDGRHQVVDALALPRQLFRGARQRDRPDEQVPTRCRVRLPNRRNPRSAPPRIGLERPAKRLETRLGDLVLGGYLELAPHRDDRAADDRHPVESTEAERSFHVRFRATDEAHAVGVTDATPARLQGDTLGTVVVIAEAWEAWTVNHLHVERWCAGRERSAQSRRARGGA
jgi:hypothetical protein